MVINVSFGIESLQVQYGTLYTGIAYIDLLNRVANDRHFVIVIVLHMENICAKSFNRYVTATARIFDCTRDTRSASLVSSFSRPL